MSWVVGFAAAIHRARKRRIIAFALGILLAISIIVGAMTPETTSCTMKACQCSRDGSQGQEVPCNTCAIRDPVLITGIVDLIRTCDAREFVMCPASPDACAPEGELFCSPIASEVRTSGACSLSLAWFGG